MDTIIVAIIVTMAVVFTVRNLIKTYKGESSCGCSGCSCSDKDNCETDFPMNPNP